VTKTQSAGPMSCLEHRTTRVLHCAIVTRAAVLMFPLLLQTVISNQMRPRRLRGEKQARNKECTGLDVIRKVSCMYIFSVCIVLLHEPTLYVKTHDMSCL